MKQITAIPTHLNDCYILEPDRYNDERGYFSPFYLEENLNELGFHRVVQANRSKSSKGVLRGLHYQEDPKCQAKVVEVINGAAIDVAVDIRENSSTYGKYIGVLLTPDNNRQLLVPRGFAHGFLSLEDDTIFQYLIDNDFAPDKEGGIIYNDPDIAIPWDEYLSEYGIDEPILSDKDVKRRTLKNTNIHFRR